MTICSRIASIPSVDSSMTESPVLKTKNNNTSDVLRNSVDTKGSLSNDKMSYPNSFVLVIDENMNLKSNSSFPLTGAHRINNVNPKWFDFDQKQIDSYIDKIIDHTFSDFRFTDFKKTSYWNRYHDKNKTGSIFNRSSYIHPHHIITKPYYVTSMMNTTSIITRPYSSSTTNSSVMAKPCEESSTPVIKITPSSPPIATRPSEVIPKPVISTTPITSSPSATTTSPITTTITTKPLDTTITIPVVTNIPTASNVPSTSPSNQNTAPQIIPTTPDISINPPTSQTQVSSQNQTQISTSTSSISSFETLISFSFNGKPATLQIQSPSKLLTLEELVQIKIS